MRNPVTLCRIVRPVFPGKLTIVETTLKLGLYFLGMAAICIGGSMALFGPHAVGTFFNTILNFVYDAGPLQDLDPVNVDSEMRFYAVMFVFYGGVLIQTVRDLDRYAARVPLLLGVFALAGTARLIGFLTTGQPHALFILLMSIEFALPAVLYVCWLGRKRNLTSS